jgi:hypothetical protein
LHRVVKLLEGQVGRGRHWRKCRRRREEVGDVLCCGKMMEVLYSGGGKVSGRHLWLYGSMRSGSIEKKKKITLKYQAMQ